GTVKVTKPVHTANDLVQGHGLQTAITLPLGRDTLAKIVIRNQIVGPASEDRDKVMQKRALTRSLEVMPHLFLEWSAHRLAGSGIVARHRATIRAKRQAVGAGGCRDGDRCRPPCGHRS